MGSGKLEPFKLRPWPSQGGKRAKRAKPNRVQSTSQLNATIFYWVKEFRRRCGVRPTWLSEPSPPTDWLAGCLRPPAPTPSRESGAFFFAVDLATRRPSTFSSPSYLHRVLFRLSSLVARCSPQPLARHASHSPSLRSPDRQSLRAQKKKKKPLFFVLFVSDSPSCCAARNIIRLPFKTKHEVKTECVCRLWESRSPGYHLSFSPPLPLSPLPLSPFPLSFLSPQFA